MSFYRFLSIALLSAFLAASCRSAQRYIESGDYDAAISFAVSKLRGKKNKKTDIVKSLELAFAKAQARDLNTAYHLASVDRPENWERINGIHRQIRQRQNLVAPLLPLVSKDGYRAKIEFVNIAQLESESREKAASYLYTCAEDLLNQAEQRGDRQAAREAYRLLKDLENRYFKSYRNKEALLRDAVNLGTTHILFEVHNESNKVLPRDFNDRVLAFGTSDLNGDWKAYHFKPDPKLPVDYRVVFNVRQVDISPERINERTYTDEKEIEDGWEYVLDERGNVKKDTAGNDIKRPRKVRIRAEVLEAFQTKAVRLAGVLEIFNADSHSRVHVRDVGTEVLFEHYASTFRGDQRALSKDSRARIGNRPLPFPLDGDMLMQAADRLKSTIREALRNSRAIL
ncbi:MAG: hypothetical protein ABMA02_02265 [Saprospiraceae bacterium]